MSESYKLGQKGEDVATEYLKTKGYRIEANRWHLGHLELDIVAIDQQTGELVFVEVKTRTSSNYGAPEEAVDYRKMMRLVRAADAYIKRYGHLEDWRFDIISVIQSGQGQPQIDHIVNAFYPPLG